MTKSLLQSNTVAAKAEPPAVVAADPELARATPVVAPVEQKILKAFSVERRPAVIEDGKEVAPSGWAFVAVSYCDDGKIVSIERDPAKGGNLKPIAVDRFKIAALKYWTSQ